jgi:quercetin dioxygenase-like cupin family protein
MVRIIKPEDAKSPAVPASAKHGGVTMKVYVDQNIGSKTMWVGIGDFESGGLVETHRHADSEHCYYIIKGEIIVISDEGRHKLTKGMMIWIGPDENHGIANESSEVATYMCISCKS